MCRETGSHGRGRTSTTPRSGTECPARYPSPRMCRGSCRSHR